jgi:hypothetical protein
LTPVVWLLVGPWDLSTVSANGRQLSESSGGWRVLLVLAVMDFVAVICWWRRWLTLVATMVGAAIAWTLLAYTISIRARVSGANMAALWLFLGPIVVAWNAIVAFVTEQIVRAIRRERQQRRP